MPAPPVSEWHPRHDLDRIDITMHWLDGDLAGVSVIGRSDTKRTSLWCFDVVPELNEGTSQTLMALHDDLLLIGRCQPVDREQLDQALRHGTLVNVVETLPLF